MVSLLDLLKVMSNRPFRAPLSCLIPRFWERHVLRLLSRSFHCASTMILPLQFEAFCAFLSGGITALLFLCSKVHNIQIWNQCWSKYTAEVSQDRVSHRQRLFYMEAILPRILLSLLTMAWHVWSIQTGHTFDKLMNATKVLNTWRMEFCLRAAC